MQEKTWLLVWIYYVYNKAKVQEVHVKVIFGLLKKGLDSNK